VDARVSVIIPTLRAGRSLPALLDRLHGQSLRPLEIIVTDSSSDDGTADLARRAGCQVEVIPPETFDHGGTRNRGARMASGNILMFMTQDALPARDDFLEAIVRPIVTGRAAAAYARQIPRADARPSEVFARRFNYPDRPEEKRLADISRLGIRAFFFSNAAAAVAREPFEAVGGFPEGVIMNEDMLLCAKLLRGGYTVAYESAAVVYHAHRYTIGRTLRRYFDIGIFRAQAGPLLAGAAWTGQGFRFTAGLFGYLLRSGAWTSLPRAASETFVKLAGVQLGRCHRWIPGPLKQRLSLHRVFWSPGAGGA